MLESATRRTSFLDSFRIEDRESCTQAIKNGGIAALVSAGLTGILAIGGLFVSPEDETLAYVMDPAALFDVGLLLLLAFFVFRRSRVAATLLLGYFVASKILIWTETGMMSGFIVTMIFFLLYANAARGTYLWHSRYRDDRTGASAAGLEPAETPVRRRPFER